MNSTGDRGTGDRSSADRSVPAGGRSSADRSVPAGGRDTSSGNPGTSIGDPGMSTGDLDRAIDSWTSTGDPGMSTGDLDRAIDSWLSEDIGEGDHTTLSTIPENATGSALLLVKEPGIVAGLKVAQRIFTRFDSELQLSFNNGDGERIRPGDLLFRVTGSVRSILQCERLVLNILQRMSGIATRTGLYVEQLEGTRTRILDTRKTTPGLRMLEKEAVRLGGGYNHRVGLFDMILIKDNHIDFAGGITAAIRAAQEYLRQKGMDLSIEVETRSISDVEEVIRTGGVLRILLDNFTPEQTRQAVEMIDHRFETESSGNIILENIREYALCGVDFISVGALTHHIKSLDLSLKAEFVRPNTT